MKKSLHKYLIGRSWLLKPALLIIVCRIDWYLWTIKGKWYDYTITKHKSYACRRNENIFMQ